MAEFNSMGSYMANNNDALKIAQLKIASNQARQSSATKEKQARDTLAAQLYNQGGNAYSLHTIQSRGVGDYDVPGLITFQVTFVAEPFFTSGVSLVGMPQGATKVPWGAATVRAWQRNEKGAYSGAFISLHVSAPELANDEGGDIDSANYILTHYLSFQALAYKDLGQGVETSIQSIVTRSPGF